MVIDLKIVKDILEQEVIEPMDHRFLNYEVKPFDSVVPTTANVAQEIWRRLESRFAAPSYALANVRLYETQDCYVDISKGGMAGWISPGVIVLQPLTACTPMR